tara:strand:+ start:68 stop:2071 length:2004 start_codon:yes stop_codon:yes gene_type:complete
MSNLNINIAIVGCISSGKSTLLNSIFIEQYSNMKIKRDTMVPQVYKETNDETKYKSKEEILEENTAINEKYQVESETEFTIDECIEVEHFIPKNKNFIEMDENIFINYYDIPGLNDCATKDIYYEWFDVNFYKFDLIIYIVDINSAMNTSDEKDILNNIKTNIIGIKEGEGRDIKLIVLVNKCDDLVFTDTDTSLHINDEYFTLDDDELDDMYQQIQTVFNNNLKEDNINYEIIPISAIDIFVYRHLQNKPNVDLDIKFLNKFGENEFGRRVWKRMNIEDKNEKIHDHFKDNDNYNEALKNTGFINMISTIKDILNKDNQFKIFSDKIKNRLNELEEYIAYIDTKLNNIQYTPINEQIDKLVEIYKILHRNICNINENYKQNSDLYDSLITNIQDNILNLITNYFKFSNDSLDDLTKLEDYKFYINKFYINDDIINYNIKEKISYKNIKELLDTTLRKIEFLQNEYYIKEIGVYDKAYENFPNIIIQNFLEKLSDNKYTKFEELIDNIFTLCFSKINCDCDLNKIYFEHEEENRLIKFCNYIKDNHEYPIQKISQNLEKWLLNRYIVSRLLETDDNKSNVIYPYLIQYKLRVNNFYKEENNHFYKKLSIMNSGAVYYDLNIEDLNLIEDEKVILQVFNYYRELYKESYQFTYETEFSDGEEEYHSSD